MQAMQFPGFEFSHVFDEFQKAETFDQAIGIIDSLRRSMLGAGSLTINANITPHAGPTETIVLQRLWSSSSAAAVNGRKRKEPVEWTERLLRRCEIVVSEGDARIAEVFDDHAELRAADVHSIINFPIVEDGRCVATVNLMSNRSRCFPGEVAVGSLIALLARPWVLPAAKRLLSDLARQSEAAGAAA